MRTTEAINKFEKSLDQLAYSQTLWSVFQDFLDYSLLMLKWWDPNPTNFAELEKRWPEKKQHILFWEAYLAMADIADNEGEGFQDPFGNYFMDHFSNDHRGQFFTPDEVCDMIALLQVCETAQEKKIPVYVTQHAVAVGHFYLQLN
jgi:hypothetical protein